MSIAHLITAALREPWTAAKGASKYAKAIAAGDVAGHADKSARRAACRACPSRIQVTVEGAADPSDWCGPPFEDRLDKDPPTCGCLCAGKTAVASERCPQDRWSS